MQVKFKLQSTDFTSYQSEISKSKTVNYPEWPIIKPNVGDIIDSTIIGAQLPKEDAWDNLRELNWKAIEVLWSIDEEGKLFLKKTVVPAA
jgi:hypothetical protein